LPTTAAAITGSAPVFNQWNHIAVCRSGTSTRLFLNGIQQGSTFTDSKNYGAVSLTVGKDNAGSTHVTGNMSNIRIVKGTALYTGPFVPPQAPLTAVTNTQLLMNFSNGAIFDYATGAVLETVGDTKLNTTIKKYGTASIAFDGAGDSLDFVPNPVGSFSQRGSWTIEMWVYPTNLSVAQYFYSQNTSNFLQLVISSTGFLQVDRSGVGTAITSSSALTINTWQHVALVSDGTNLKLYVNGTQTGNTIAVGTQVDPSSSIIRIGAYQNSGGAPTLPFYGYLDDIRISRYARYTANFTPPTSALPVF